MAQSQTKKVSEKLIVEREKTRKLSTEIEEIKESRIKRTGNSSMSMQDSVNRTPLKRNEGSLSQAQSNKKFIELQSNFKDLQRNYETEKKQKERISR